MKYLTEQNGKGSSNRMIFVIGMVWAMASSTLFVLTLDWSPGEFIAAFGSQAGVFTALKLGQKPMEKKD